MNDSPPESSEPGNARDVNVTVNVNAGPSPAASPPATSLVTLIGSVIVGLVTITAVIGQLTASGVLTITFFP